MHGACRIRRHDGGQTISAYTVESSSEAICTVSVSADGTLILTGKSHGICTIRLTYQGYTAKFYYTVGYDGIPPFDAYISSGNA